MALKATIFKADLQLSDLDRNYYASHNLTLARHPSETDERLMVRLLAFALHADEHLEFTRGLSASDEPDLWQTSASGEIDLWIDIGLPDASRIRKACHRARQVVIYCYGERTVQPWWQQLDGKLTRFENLTVRQLPPASTAALVTLTARTMRLQCNIQDDLVWLGDERNGFSVDYQTLLAAQPQASVARR